MAEPKRERDVESPRGAPRPWMGIAAAVVIAGGLVWRCSKPKPDDANGAEREASSEKKGGASSGPTTGFAAPISAVHVGSEVIVAGFDVGAKAIRVQRIDAKDEVVADKLVLRDLSASPDSELKLFMSATPHGGAVRWRGLRGGQLVRELLTFDGTLAPKGDPQGVPAASCSTRDALWFSDGSHAFSRPWAGPSVRVSLPKEKEASLLCGQTRAFAVLEDENKRSVLALGADASPRAEVTMMREAEFGEDEQRELAEYTVADEVGFVRLSTSGALALRELTESAGPLHKLKHAIGRDDDVVAVDASTASVVIVYTTDVSEAARDGATSDTTACTKITALRVARKTLEESTVELSAGRCGYEVGPFFTSAMGEGVSVAWAERTGGQGRPRASVAALAHVVVAKTDAPRVERLEQAADALADAGCDATSCYAVALVRREADDAGILKVLRYK